MAELSLKAQSPLRGYKKNFGQTSLRELENVSIYSIALAQSSESALDSIRHELRVDWPKIGISNKSSDGIYQLLGLQVDQIFALVHAESNNDGQAVRLPQLADSAYITDQSDGWVGLRLEGPGALAALERSCPVDLHDSVFAVGRVTRTSMEHLSVIILRDNNSNYLLLSPASSAMSFVHMLETSLRNTLG